MEIVKDIEECECGKTMPEPQGALLKIRDNILANSWIKQDDLALNASLSLISVLISRKFVFGNLAPNLYLLNIAPSGSGKDACQQQIKKYLSDIGQNHLLGAGDYVSDASLMDSLGVKPTRLDIMDECGGILKTMTQGKSDYGSKMSDILAELYTTSNSEFLGRATAAGVQGGCTRPNVNLLLSTTPKGFADGVSLSALQKGLLGRIIVAFGRGDRRAERLKEFPKLDKETLKFLRELAEFDPEVNFDFTIGGIEQMVQELKATESANILLDNIFEELDLMRVNSSQDNVMLPIISRLYQQMSKIAMVHSCGRLGKDAIIDDCDVKFAYEYIMYYYEKMKVGVAKLVHINYNERMFSDILDLIPKLGDEGITSQALAVKTRYLGKRKRDEMVNELLETGEIVKDRINRKDRNCIVYWRTK